MPLHRMALTKPFLEHYFECFTLKHHEKFILIQSVPIEVGRQTITS